MGGRFLANAFEVADENKFGIQAKKSCTKFGKDTT